MHSPLGRALPGHGPDTISYATPDGPARATVLDLRIPGDAEPWRHRGSQT